MQTCDDGHDEVCYNCRECPVCEKQKELEAAQNELMSANDRIEQLELGDQ